MPLCCGFLSLCKFFVNFLIYIDKTTKTFKINDKQTSPLFLSMLKACLKKFTFATLLAAGLFVEPVCAALPSGQSAHQNADAQALPIVVAATEAPVAQDSVAPDDHLASTPLAADEHMQFLMPDLPEASAQDDDLPGIAQFFQTTLAPLLTQEEANQCLGFCQKMDDAKGVMVGDMFLNHSLVVFSAGEVSAFNSSLTTSCVLVLCKKRGPFLYGFITSFDAEEDNGVIVAEIKFDAEPYVQLLSTAEQALYTASTLMPLEALTEELIAAGESDNVIDPSSWPHVMDGAARNFAEKFVEKEEIAILFFGRV